MCDLPPFDIVAARRFLEQKEDLRKRLLAERLEQARMDFDSIVNHIVVKYRPARVFQWGSLMDDAHFSEISDIDIAPRQHSGLFCGTGRRHEDDAFFVGYFGT